MIALYLLEFLALALVLACSMDVVRLAHWRTKPVRSVVFALLAIGSFGQLLANAHGFGVHWWALALHLGVAIPVVAPYAIRFAAWRRSHGTHRESAGDAI